MSIDPTMSTPSSQLSPRGALMMGLLFIAFGMFPILTGLGILTPTDAGSPVPTWVPVAAGLAFIVGGATIIVDFAVIGGVGPDGDLRPGTPMSLRIVSLLLALTIVGLMTAISGWVAFGSGPRHFTSTLSFPFATKRWQSGELSGRAMFGVGTALGVVVLVAGGIGSVRRLLTDSR